MYMYKAAIVLCCVSVRGIHMRGPLERVWNEWPLVPSSVCGWLGLLFINSGSWGPNCGIWRLGVVVVVVSGASVAVMVVIVAGASVVVMVVVVAWASV